MIATVTLNPAVDYTVSIPDLSPDRVNRAEAGSVRYDAGGAGINVSLALAALGAETAATGVLGGFTGAYVRGELAGAPFAADFVDGDGVTRLNATVLAGGDAYKINQRGPETGERVVAAVADRVRQFDPATLVVGGSLPPGLDAGALDRLAAAGDWETALDVPGGLLEGVDAGRYSLCAPNRAELEAATDHPVGTVAACRRAAARLRERGFDRVVASLGADGALLVSAAGALYGEVPPGDPVDTAGAGDALLAGVLAAFARGEGEAAALRSGLGAAAATAGVAGTDPPADLAGGRDGVAVTRLD